jgi:hypothetical protein
MADAKQRDFMEEAIGSKSYNNAFTITVQRNITRNEFVEICSDIHFCLDEIDKENKLINHLSIANVIPERISEGGIEIIFNKVQPYEGYDIAPYKSLRFIGYSGWPFINKAWISDDTILFKKGTILFTFLKAFHGAPLWTIDEIHSIKFCFEQRGCKITNMGKCKWLVREKKERQDDEEYLIQLQQNELRNIALMERERGVEGHVLTEEELRLMVEEQ